MGAGQRRLLGRRNRVAELQANQLFRPRSYWALVLDLSVLKGLSQRWADQYLARGHYVGVMPVLSAPYLSDGRDELEAATADLFKNSIFCLMPSAKADPQAVDTAVNFGRLLGANPYFVDPMEYDSLVQGIETLPGLTAAALFGTLKKTTGWRDILRFANSSFALGTQSLQHGTDITSLALNDKASRPRSRSGPRTESRRRSRRPA